MLTKEKIDEVLTETEKSKLSQFAMDEDMREAVKKVVLFPLYYEGIMKKGIKVDPMQNFALIFSHDPTLTDSELANFSRAAYHGINMLSMGFNNIDKYKLEKMPDIKPNQAR
jgi:hypothetical protein